MVVDRNHVYYAKQGLYFLIFCYWEMMETVAFIVMVAEMKDTEPEEKR